MSTRRKSRRTSKGRSKSQASTSSNKENEDIDSNTGTSDINFTIKTSKVMGRYMVAARQFRPGDEILSETPLVVGPCTGCKVQCIGCYQELEEYEDISKCKICGWPICCDNCPGINKPHGHSAEECRIFKETKSSRFLDYHDVISLRQQLHIIAPFRCLLLKTTNTKAYEVLTAMEAHNEIRKTITEVWRGNQINIVNRIRRDWGLDKYSENEIHTACGILEVNAFEIGQNGVTLRGVYPTAFLMSHDCVPNTNHCDEEKEYRLTVRASTNIFTNQPITLSYAHTLQSTLKRRQDLLENKFFECKCQRCSDATELETYCSALYCPKCKKGFVLSTNPLDSEAVWHCNNKTQRSAEKCPGYTVTAKSMKLLIDKITDEVDSIDCNDITGMEAFLQRYRNVLHPNHYICLGIKLSLSQLYGKINGYIINELSDELLERKKEICKEILKVFDVIEPGFTRLRGVTLYELHAPIMISTVRIYENSSMPKAILRRRLKEVVKYLEESTAILASEPETSSEGIMGVAAKEALDKIKDWEKILGKF